MSYFGLRRSAHWLRSFGGRVSPGSSGVRTLKLLTICLGILCGLPANASDSLKEWRFDVFLDEREIGTHAFRVEQRGDVVELESEASFDVRLLFINAFRYRHRAEETWNGQCLVDIRASTAVNRESFSVSGAATDTGFQLNTQNDDGDLVSELPECVQSFAYWDLDRLRGNRLLNPQTGDFETVELTRLSPQSLRVGDVQLPAERYQLMVAGKPLTLWYAADDGRWLALESEARGGRMLRYQPRAVPAAGPQRAS